MLKDLSKRFVTSLFLGIFLICMVVFANNEWVRWLNILVSSAIAGVAVWEFTQFAKEKGGKTIFPFLMAMSGLEILSFYLSASYSWAQGVPVLFFFLFLLTLFALHFHEKEGAIVNLSISLFPILYIATPVGMSLAVLYSNDVDGRWWFFYLIFVTKITDIGAYFAGNLFGRRKLAPHISPSKTLEGALFGLGFALLSSYGFHAMSQLVNPSNFRLGTLEWVVLGLLLGVTGQFSDLAESLLKRDANKKDSNRLPGLGGALDTIDSLLFNAPIIYFYLFFIKI